jgi:hypothetical protein
MTTCAPKSDRWGEAKRRQRRHVGDEAGLDEQTVLNVIAIWEKWRRYAGPYRKDLSALLNETVDA